MLLFLSDDQFCHLSLLMPALLCELPAQEVANDRYHLMAFPDDEVVFAIDDVQLGILIDGVVLLAAPKRHYAVLVAVDDADRTLIVPGHAVDVQLLRLQKVVPAQLEMVEALDILRRVLRIEAVAEEMAALRGFLDDGAGRQQDERFRPYALASCRHAGYDSALGVPQQGDAGDVGE